MSEPTNAALRNAMTEHERQCYDWGWEDAEERIIALLETDIVQCKPTHNCEDCEPIRYCIALIKGEQK